MSKTSVVYTATGRCQTRSHAKEGFHNGRQLEDKQEVPLLGRGGRRPSVGNKGNINMAKGQEGVSGRKPCKSDLTKDVVSRSKLGRKSKSPGKCVIRPGTNNSAYSKTARQNPQEVICLSDSEDVDAVPPPQPLRTLTNTTNTKGGSEKNPNQPDAAATSTSSGLNSDLKTPPPKQNIEDYYRSRGVTLSHVRRLNRNYVRHDGLPGEARGVVFWDSFSPPPGYTMDDLPASDSQDMSQSTPPKPTISPVILLAEKYKHRHRRFMCPKATDADFEEIMQRLTKRKVYDNDNEVPENPNPTKRSTPETAEPKGTGLSEPVAQSSNQVGQSDTFNSTFPILADDLNDSALMACSQQVELQYNQNKARDDSFENVNVADVGGYEDFKPQGANLGEGPGGASTPLTDSFVIRKRTIFPETAVIENNRNLSDTSSSISLFESSDRVSSGSSNSRRSSSRDIQLAKKNLFNVKSAETEPSKVSGDFMDDDDDELFSQIEMPVLPEPTKAFSKVVPNKGMRNNLSEMPTQLIYNDDNNCFPKNEKNIDNCSISSGVKGCRNNGVIKRLDSPFKLFKKLKVEMTVLDHKRKSSTAGTRMLRNRMS